MFDNLSDKMQNAFRSLAGTDKLTADNIEEAISEVRKALLEADVSLKVVKIFISNVRQKVLGIAVLEGVSPYQQFVKVVSDELTTILGGELSPLETDGKPAVIMMVGLQGAGKTTACGKLALKLKEEGHKPLLVACDVQRPAAIHQLETLGKQVGVPVFTIAGGQDVQDIAEGAVAKAKAEGFNPVILDTAGRLQVDTPLMAELLIIDKVLKPAEKILVIDAMTGQEAVNVAETFNTQLSVTGLLLTKIDGDARGGAALSVREAVGKPIKYISTGEKLENLEAFYPDRMASRILGMGDVVSLVEKVQKNIDEKEAEKAVMDMFQNEFSFEMFMSMQKMMKKMGPMGDVMKMMGMGAQFGISSADQNKIAEQGDKMMARYEIVINSMTVAERRKPEIIDFPRRRRIARGSGVKDAEIGEMLNDFEKMRSMFSMFKGMMGGGMPNFPGMPGGGFPKMPGGFGNMFGGGGMPPMPPGFGQGPGMNGMPPMPPGFGGFPGMGNMGRPGFGQGGARPTGNRPAPLPPGVAPRKKKKK